MTRPSPALVTVAMPVLDEERNIGDQLAALARQTYSGPWEVVIADNGCTDRTVEVAATWRDRLPALRIVDAGGRRGINHARNMAAGAAGGDLLAFCDADDVAAPGWLASLARAAPDADLVGGSLDPVALNPRQVLDWHDRPVTETALPVAHGLLPYVPGGNCAVWAEIARDLRWDESFEFGSSDIDFSWRAQLAGHRLAFAPDAVMHRRLARTLPEVARRFYHYGRSDPHLYRHHGRLGMRAPGTKDDAIPWWRLASEAPRLRVSAVTRGFWLTTLARHLGRVAATTRLPRPARRARPDLLEVDLGWPPETFLRWKLEGLAARGLRVAVSSTSGDPRVRVPGTAVERQPSWDEPKARKAAGLAGALPLLLAGPGRTVALARAARRSAGSPLEAAGVVRRFAQLAHAQPAVAHFEWETAAIDHLALIEAWTCPVVVSSHGGLAAWPFAGQDDRRLRRLPALLERISVLLCVCDAQREDAIRLGADPRMTRVIRQGVDSNVFSPPRETGAPGEGALQLVAVGRLVWEKGWEYLIESVRMLGDAGVAAHLRICGDGPERERIAVAVADLGLERDVTLLGSQPWPTVRGLLQEADAFVLASVVEGLPISMLEAMACGLAVVVTDCGGVPEAVEHGVSGLIVPAREPAAMARALGDLAADPQRRREMGRAGRRRVRADFALDRQLDEFEQLYGELAARAA